MGDISKLLILAGIFLVVLGLLLAFWTKIPLLGKLPGDFSFSIGNFRFYAPLATSIIISIVLTIIVSLVINRFR